MNKEKLCEKLSALEVWAERAKQAKDEKYFGYCMRTIEALARDIQKLKEDACNE